MKKRIFGILLTLCMALSLLPATAFTAEDEQFTLTPGSTYYFDLSGENIPGQVNSNLPDQSLHYVPFTYAGTIEAYKLTSETRTTETYAQQNKYAHSLFVANHGITHTVNWNNLDAAGLILGKDYASGSVNYTLRTPSTGSRGTGSGGTPTSNEWDIILDKNSEYIQNWSEMYSFGQDTVAFSTVYCSFRGYDSNRAWNYQEYAHKKETLGFRPVLEVLNSNALGSDGLKTVTLELNGGTLGGNSDNIQIIVKSNSTFTAPAAEGLTAPTGYGAANSKWQDDNGSTYAPGDSVPAGVTRLTVQWHDIVAPSIAGLTDGQTYCSAVEFTAADNDSVASVTVNGAPIQAVNGKYTLTPAQGEQVVKVSDNAGNSVTVTVIVNDGHTPKADDGNCTTAVNCKVCGYEITAAQREHSWSDWVHNTASHTRTCNNPGCGVTQSGNCSGGTATCTEQAVCTVCGGKYGDLKPHSFTAENTDEQYLKSAATCTEPAVYYKSCAVCGLSSEDLTNEDTFQSGSILDHNFGAWTSNGDGTHTRKCQNADCTASETEVCSGGTANCHDKAICEVCGAGYGEVDTTNHVNLKHIAAKAATVDTEGNTEYWHCPDCGKYFADAAGAKEITQADTVTAKQKVEVTSPTESTSTKEPASSTEAASPRTADSSMPALWLTLLGLSGGAILALAITGKKEKHSR